VSYTYHRDLDFLMSGIIETTSGIFGAAYVNRKIFPNAVKVFLRYRCRA